MVLLNLCTFLDAGLESFSALGTAAPAPGARDHAMFYAVAQAVFYIFCFRWRDLRDVDYQEEDSVRSPAATYPNAGSLELSPQLMPVLGAASYSSASSSGTSAAMRGSHGWAPGLSIVQRAITSPLNPLRYCNANVVQQFAYVSQHTGFQYCYSIIEANARRTKTTGTTDDTPGTPQRARLSTDVRESTPTPHRDDAPAPAPALLGATETLDAFFPFDPYRLRESSGLVERLYREWADVAPEEEDDDEDAEGDDVSSSDSEVHGAERFTRFSARARSRVPPGATPESVAQSLEAMSISPFAV